MAAIWTSKQPWTRRPSGIVTPNAGSPQATGLLVWWPIEWAGTGTNNGGSATHYTPYKAGRNPFGHHHALDLNTGGWSHSNIRHNRELGGWAFDPSGVTYAGYNNARGNLGIEGGNLGPVNAPHSVSVWVNPNNVLLNGGTAPIGWGDYDDGTLNSSRGIYVGTGPVWGFGRRGVTTVTSSVAPVVGRWDHLVGVTNGTNLHRFYVNGVLAGESTTAWSETNTLDWLLTNCAYRSSGYSGEGLNGQVSDIRFYTRALSGGEVRALYDPRSRWELYQPLVRRVVFDLGGGGGGTTYNDTLAFGVNVEVAQNSAAIFAGSVALATSAGFANAGPRIGSDTLSFGTSAAVTPAGPLTAQGALSLGTILGLTPTGLASLLGALQLSTSLSLSPAANLIQAIALSLGISAGTTFAAPAEGGSIYNESLALDISLGLTPGTSYITQALATYATQVGLTPAGVKVTTDTASYGVSAAMSQSVATLLVNTLTLQITADIARVTQLATSGLVSLGLSADVIAQTTATFNDTLTLAVAGLFTAISREFVFADPYLFPSSAAQSTLADRLQTPLTEVGSPTTALQQAVTEFVAVTSRLSEN